MCGTLEIGKRADLILIDIDRVHNQPVNEIFSQLVHCAKASDVQTVLVDGEILMRNRRLTHLEEGLVLARAKSCNRDLMDRLNSIRW
jgi:5-methylthioadenosine/S-adenosylhomocysteine deaminase